MKHFLDEFFDKTFAEFFIIGNFEASTASTIMTTYVDKVISFNENKFGNTKPRSEDLDTLGAEVWLRLI